MRQGFLMVEQAACSLGGSSSTLRRWHDTGRVIPDLVDEITGYRYYSTQQIAALRGCKHPSA